MAIIENVKHSANEMRILHGFASGAGQPPQIARAQRELGFHSVSMHVGPNKLGFNFDRVIEKADFNDRANLFSKLIDEFNVFHFYAFPLFGWKNKIEPPFGLDLLFLKLLKLPVVMNFRGSEVRQKDLFDKYARYSFAEGEDHGLFKNFPCEEQRKYINLCRNLATKIIVPDAELASYVPGAIIIPRAIDISKWKNYGQINSVVPLVVHAPTRRHVKGTSYIINAVERLRAKGLKFEFKLVEGLSNDEARAVYEKADIIIDQLKIGWHGVLSTEAMSLGKVTMCYIRDDLLNSLEFDGQLPLINTNEDNIDAELENIILNPHRRVEIGNRARSYVENVHSLDIVAKQLIDLYSQAKIDAENQKTANANFCGDLLSLYCSSIQENKRKINSSSVTLMRSINHNELKIYDRHVNHHIANTSFIKNSREIFLKALKYEASGKISMACVEYKILLSHPDSIYSNKKYLNSKLRALRNFLPIIN